MSIRPDKCAGLLVIRKVGIYLPVHRAAGTSSDMTPSSPRIQRSSQVPMEFLGRKQRGNLTLMLGMSILSRMLISIIFPVVEMCT